MRTTLAFELHKTGSVMNTTSRSLQNLALAAVCACAFTLSASAVPINPFYLSTSAADSTGGLEVFTYKSNVGGVEEGVAAGIFDTVYSPASEPFTATITWTGVQPILESVSLKAGSNLWTWTAAGALATFNLGASTNLYDGLILSHNSVLFDPRNAISHVSLNSEGPSVPDGGASIILLGAALTALGFSRRFLRR
jgi:hypothetical protein